MGKYPAGWDKAHEVAKRRRLLAELMVTQQDHRLTLEETAKRLATGRTRIGADGELETDPTSVSLNHDGEPWSLSTLSRDLEEVREDWRREATRAIASYKQEILAQYQRMLEIYWERLDLTGVNTVLKEIRELLGTDTERIAVFEQVREQMDTAAKRLRADFGHDPALLALIYRSISGRSDPALLGLDPAKLQN